MSGQLIAVVHHQARLRMCLVIFDADGQLDRPTFSPAHDPGPPPLCVTLGRGPAPEGGEATHSPLLAVDPQRKGRRPVAAHVAGVPTVLPRSGAVRRSGCLPFPAACRWRADPGSFRPRDRDLRHPGPCQHASGRQRRRHRASRRAGLSGTARPGQQQAGRAWPPPGRSPSQAGSHTRPATRPFQARPHLGGPDRATRPPMPGNGPFKFRAGDLEQPLNAYPALWRHSRQINLVPCRDEQPEHPQDTIRCLHPVRLARPGRVQHDDAPPPSPATLAYLRPSADPIPLTLRLRARQPGG